MRHNILIRYLKKPGILRLGGYQPAQKWLKDRKGRLLDFDDILYYQQIIMALADTIRLQSEIDNLLGYF